MGTNPQDALNRLIAAFEAHAQAVRTADMGNLAIVEAAEARLCEAFFIYDDVLFNKYGVDLPLEVIDEDVDEDDFDDEDFDADYDDEDDWPLDPEEFDEDDELTN